jgi:hypothetical protein
LNITKISKDKVALDPKTSKIFVKQWSNQHVTLKI